MPHFLLLLLEMILQKTTNQTLIIKLLGIFNPSRSFKYSNIKFATTTVDVTDIEIFEVELLFILGVFPLFISKYLYLTLLIKLFQYLQVMQYFTLITISLHIVKLVGGFVANF